MVHPKISIFVTHLSIRLCEYLQWKHVLIYSKWTPKKHGSWNQIEGYATTHVYTIGIVIAHYGNPLWNSQFETGCSRVAFLQQKNHTDSEIQDIQIVFPWFFPMFMFFHVFSPCIFPMFFCDPSSLSPLENCGPKFPRQHAPKGNGCRAPPPPPPATGLMGLMGDIL